MFFTDSFLRVTFRSSAVSYPPRLPVFYPDSGEDTKGEMWGEAGCRYNHEIGLSARISAEMSAGVFGLK
jgi:hypothetical protein